MSRQSGRTVPAPEPSIASLPHEPHEVGAEEHGTRSLYRQALIGYLAGNVLVVSLAIIFTPRSILVPMTAACLVGLIGIAATFRGLTRSGRSRRLSIAVIASLVNVSAVCDGLAFPISNDSAILVPFVAAVLLISVFEGRTLRVGLIVCWASGVVANLFARSGAELSSIPGHNEPLISAAELALLSAVVYLGLGWVSERLRAAKRRAEMAAQETEKAAETMRLISAASPLATLAFDGSGKLNGWNPAAERLTGWSAEEALGKSIEALVPDGEWILSGGSSAEASAADRRPDRASQKIAKLRRRDGREVLVEAYRAVELDASGGLVGTVVQLLDVTEREAVSERLKETQKLEAIGQLAGGIAHDFNNSLTAIGGFASMIASGTSPEPAEDAQVILEAAQRASALTKQLLSFSRRVSLQPQFVDLREYVRSSENLVRALVGERIKVVLDLCDLPAVTLIDPATLEQAVLNLAANARDAMPDGGRITLAVGIVPDCDSGKGEGHRTHLSVLVGDTGHGIAEDALPRIFEPFYTTKAPKGTGLGLPMVHGFVTQSGGHVLVESSPGKGTSIDMHFPQSAGVVARPPEPMVAIGGTESILFVEDNPEVAAFGLACLVRLGYRVTSAQDGAEAAAIAAASQTPYDLAMTDVVLPGVSGPRLAEQIQGQWPTTRILYATGYSTDRDAEIVAAPGARLLQKPYSLEQLAEAVREALSEGAGAS